MAFATPIPAKHTRYDVYLVGAEPFTKVPLAKMADLLELAKEECLAAIEASGRVDSDKGTGVEHGDPAPKPLEAPDTRANSVVRYAYKEKYRKAGNARGCGDWVHTALAAETLDGDRKIDLVRFEAIMAENGIDTSRYNRTTNGWQGRLRMSAGISLRSKASKKGFFLIDGREVRP